MIRIVHCCKDIYDIYIGRDCQEFKGSKWQNPFIIGKDGTRIEVIQKFEKYIRTKPELLKDLYELDNKILGCWCGKKACHGQILIKIRNEQLNGEHFTYENK